MNIFNFFGKKSDEMTPDEKRNKAILTFSGYAVFFILILLLGYFGNNKNSNNDNYQSTDDLKVKYEEIQNNNFDSNITIIADADILLVSIRRESKDKEIITKKYRDQVNYYFRQDNAFYEVNQEFTNYSIKKDLNIYNNYDETFLDLDNIMKVINNETAIYLAEEKSKIARYKVNETKVLSVYNSINNTQFMTNEDFDVIIDVHFNDHIVKIELELTNVYNIVNETDYENINYTMTFNDINNITLPDVNLIQ